LIGIDLTAAANNWIQI